MNQKRQEAINATLRKLTEHSTTAEQILAIGYLYDTGYANGVVYGARMHSLAMDVIQGNAPTLPPHGVAS